MAITTDLEVLQNIVHPADMDNFYSRYEYTSKDYDLKIIYPSFEMMPLEENYFRLVATSDLVPFKPRWEYRPDYVSYDFYETTIFWYIILFVNSVDRIERFRGFDKIFVPNRNTISDLISEKISRYDYVKDQDEIDSRVRFFLNTKRIHEPIQKVTRQLAPKPTEQPEEKKAEVVKVEFKEISEKFTITAVEVNKKELQLSKNPVNSTSVNVFIYPSNIPFRFGYDYIVKGSVVRWDSKDCIGNSSNLELVVRPGLILEIKYLIALT